MTKPSEPEKERPTVGEPAKPQELEAPIIQVDDARPRTDKAARSKPRRQVATKSDEFDPAALDRLMQADFESTASPGDRLEGASPLVTSDSTTADAADSVTDAEDTVEAEPDTVAMRINEVVDDSADAEKAEGQAETRQEGTGTAIEVPAVKPSPAEATTPVINPDGSRSARGVKAAKTVRSKKRQPAKQIESSARSVPSTRNKKRRTANSKILQRVPPMWLAIGGCAASALVVIILLAGLLSGPSDDERSPSRDRSVSTPTRGPRSLPTFESDLPSSYGPSGVRPMDVEEKARRREGMASFAEMGRTEEAKLRGKPGKAKPGE
jgi:hypothetical protein